MEPEFSAARRVSRVLRAAVGCVALLAAAALFAFVALQPNRDAPLDPGAAKMHVAGVVGVDVSPAHRPHEICQWPR